MSLLIGFSKTVLFTLIIGLFFKLRLYWNLSQMDGTYEGEEIDPESDKDHNNKKYTVEVSFWKILKPNSLLVIKQHYTGTSTKNYLSDWKSTFYVPEFNFLFLHGHYEYQDYDDWGFHNIQLNPNRKEISVEVISKNREARGKFLLKKV